MTYQAGAKPYEALISGHVSAKPLLYVARDKDFELTASLPPRTDMISQPLDSIEVGRSVGYK